MQRQNITEYTLLRKEIESIKKCITDYVGFLFLTVGGAFSIGAGISALAKNNITNLPLAYSALAVSYIAISMLYILMYKFLSHNRYVGYCLCLSQEKWSDAAERYDGDVLIWELCLTLLRILDIKNIEKRKVVIPQEYEQFDDVFNIVSSSHVGIKRPNCVWFFFKAMVRQYKSVTWGFPITIVRIFLIVIVSCVFITILLLYPYFEKCASGDRMCGAITGVFALSALYQIFLGYMISKRFYEVMDGESTVLRFNNKFEVIRLNILEKIYKVNAQYVLANLKNISI
jgi:hypothetical protein